MSNNDTIKRLVEYIESSFLKDLLGEENITDVSFNGSGLFIQHNLFGRKEYNRVVTAEEVFDFLRHIANLGEKHFSYSEPLLDLSFGRYRLNAVHYSLGRVQNDKAATFSLRIASDTPRINLDGAFMPNAIATLLKILIHSGQSIVIGGQTGTGKTELQKFLLRQIQDNKRVIVIDNVQELTYLHINHSLDITSWQVNDYVPHGSFQELIRNALRSHPDWLIVAESRGKEMIEILNAAMTGHPVITTIHAKNATTMINRMVRMVLMNGAASRYEEIYDDIGEHFRYYLFLNKSIDSNGRISRYLETVIEYDGETKTMIVIFDRNFENNIYGQLTRHTRRLVSSSKSSCDIWEVFNQ